MSDEEGEQTPGAASDAGEQRRLQRRLDRALEGMVLYERPWCPFCMRVNMTVRSLGLEIERVNISADPEAAKRLEAEGGKRMVPCLYIPDSGSGQWLYESADIIAYLRALVEEMGPGGEG